MTAAAGYAAILPGARIEYYTDDAEWRANRAGRIGASELATVAGAPGAYCTPYELALRLRGEAPPVEVTARMRRGAIYEGAILRLWQEERAPAAELIHPAGRLVVVHAEHPVAATLDALTRLDGQVEDAEAKNVHWTQREEWGEDGDPAGLPLRYQVQVQAQLALAGLSSGRVVADIGGDELREYPVTLDAGWTGRLFAAAADFAARVAGGWTPAPEARDLGLVKARWPEAQPVEMDLSALAGTVAAWEEARERIAALDEQAKPWKAAKDAAEAAVREAARDAERLNVQGTTYTLKTTRRKEYTCAATTYRTLKRGK